MFFKIALIALGGGLLLAAGFHSNTETQVSEKESSADSKLLFHSFKKDPNQPRLTRAKSRSGQRSDLPKRFCRKFRPGSSNHPDIEEFTIQVIYAYPAGANRFPYYKKLILGDIRYTDWFIKAQSRGRRAVVWDRGGSCGRRQLDIISVPLDLSSKEYKRMGESRLYRVFLESLEEHISADRKHYLVYADRVIGPNFPASGFSDGSTDDVQSAENDHVEHPFVGFLLGTGGRRFNGVWHLDRRETLIHEMFHGLGSVSPRAPGSNRQSHCYDGYDVMCTYDGYQPGPRPCQPWRMRIDCGRNTYFAINPRGWLKTHWNTADSPYLYGGRFRKELLGPGAYQRSFKP